MITSQVRGSIVLFVASASVSEPLSCASSRAVALRSTASRAPGSRSRVFDGSRMLSKRTRCSSSSRSRADCSEPARSTIQRGTTLCVSSLITSASVTSSCPGTSCALAQPPKSASVGSRLHNVRKSESLMPPPLALPVSIPPLNSSRVAASVRLGVSSMPSPSSRAIAAASRIWWRMVSPVTIGTDTISPSCVRILRRIASVALPTVPSAWAIGCAARSSTS